MSIGLYDDALYNKINKWVKDPNMRILKVDESTRLFQMISDQTNDKPIQLPLIALSRDSSIRILTPQKQELSYNGMKIYSDENISVQVNAIPIELKYQLDIYTRGRAEGDEYVRNFVFNFINSPKLIVDVPYNNLGFQHTSNLYLDENIQDNSDIKEHLFSDQFVRYTLTLYIDDAYLFSLPDKENIKIVGLDLDVQDRITKEIVESSVVLDKNTLN